MKIPDEGTADDEAELRLPAVVTFVFYVECVAYVGYVLDAFILESSRPTEPALEGAYIYTLGGIKR